MQTDSFQYIIHPDNAVNMIEIRQRLLLSYMAQACWRMLAFSSVAALSIDSAESLCWSSKRNAHRTYKNLEWTAKVTTKGTA